MHRPAFWAAVVAGVFVIAVAGCGESETAPGSSSAGVDPKPYRQIPGQADRMQQQLSAGGYECTRHSDATTDLRLCAKGSPTAATDEYDQPGVMAGFIRFYADEEGTVLLAKIDGVGDARRSNEWKSMRLEMLQGILSAEDAAIVVADGSNLTWGDYVPDPSEPSTGWLQARGFEPSNVTPAARPLPVTKEQALAKLTGQGLECRFGDPAVYKSEKTTLTCTDPTFESSASDGSIEGPTASLRVVDPDGAGITGMKIRGAHASIPDDLRAVRSLAPKLTALSDTAAVNDLSEWITGHLDGLPHAAYIGEHLVVITVVPESMTGDAVTVMANPEEPRIGLGSAR